MKETLPDSAAEHLLRELAPQVLGAVARRFRDFSAAEDAVQEAMLAAFTQWPQQGIPENPRGWLIQIASRRMIDQVRSEIARRERETAVAMEAETMVAAADIESDMDPEDTLILLFMCCHPALTPSSAIALTLRAVGGLTTAEIANAFLVPESTMAQRISRAKQGIKASGVPFRQLSPQERAERLPAVLHVLYLIFNEGYASSIGAQLQRLDLSREAIRLTRAAKALLPADAEVEGLLALMLLTDARREARTGPEEELIPLDRQDRALWDRAEISEGIELMTAALSKGSVGLYQLQAAIAALHDEAPRSEDTDWPQILALYELLKRVSPSPMVTLNHAIASAMVHGPSKGLELLTALDGDGRLPFEILLPFLNDVFDCHTQLRFLLAICDFLLRKCRHILIRHFFERDRFPRLVCQIDSCTIAPRRSFRSMISWLPEKQRLAMTASTIVDGQSLARINANSNLGRWVIRILAGLC